jgi:hypothetical protein
MLYYIISVVLDGALLIVQSEIYIGSQDPKLLGFLRVTFYRPHVDKHSQ